MHKICIEIVSNFMSSSVSKVCQIYLPCIFILIYIKIVSNFCQMMALLCQKYVKSIPKHLLHLLHFTLCQECVKSIMSNSYQIHITHIYFKYYLKIVSKLCQIFSPVSKLCQIYSTKIFALIYQICVKSFNQTTDV